MVSGINIEQIATFDIMSRMINSNRVSKRANFYNLYFNSNKRWTNELGINMIRSKNNFPTIINYDGNLISVKKFFNKPISNEQVIDKLLNNIFELNTKYQLISKKRINMKNFTLQEKINLLEFSYNNYRKSNIKFSQKEKENISTFLVTNIKNSYEFKDFKIKENSIYYLQPLLTSKQYLHSKEKVFVDIMFSCYRMINYSNINLSTNSMNELREYFKKNIHKFTSIKPAVSINQFFELINNYKIKYKVSKIHRNDIRYIIKKFNNRIKGITI
jgi:hypothetical protein